MKNYSDLVYKQFKINKRSIYTILGIMFGIILFTTVGYLRIFMNKVNTEYEKIHNGNYEGCFYNINKDEVNEIKNNVKIKDYGFAALESRQLINIKDVKKYISIYALDSNCISNIFNKSMEIESGTFPKKSGDVILDIVTKAQLNKNIGDIIKVGEKTYTIVGFYKDYDFNSYDFNPYEIMGITYFENISDYNSLIGFINLKDKISIKDNLLKIANNLGITWINENISIKINNGISDSDYETSLSLNGNLINCYENNNIFDFKNMNETKILFLFMEIGIIFLTIILTLSSVNLSLKEKIKYFAILRCIGATPEKIRYLLIKESLVLGGLSIIPGLVIGYLITYFIINIVLKRIGEINFYGVTFSIYWSVLITAIILVVLIILISTIIPVTKAGKISPIDTVKTGISTVTKAKKRNSKIIKKLFGYKGILAYKNIRANNRNFIMTIGTLSTLLIVLVVFTGFYTSMFKNINDTGKEKTKDFSIQINSISNEEINGKFIMLVDKQLQKNETIVKILSKIGNIKNISAYVNIELDAILTDGNMHNKVEITKDRNGYNYAPNSNMYIYDDESIKEILPYIKSTTGSDITLDNFKNNGIVLIEQNIKNKRLKHNEKTILDFNNKNKTKMYLSISDLNEVKYDKPPINVNILGTIDASNIVDGRKNENFNGVNFIVSKDFYEKNKELIFGDEKYSREITKVDFDFLSNKKREKSLQDIRTYVNEVGGWYTDNYKYAKEQRGNLLAMATLVYTVIFFTMCIGVINIINNNNISISLRKNELATMLAIGMRKEYLTQIIMLEGTIQWFISTIIGGVISYIALKILYFILIYLGDLINRESMVISAITFLVVSLILLITILIGNVMALKNIERVNIAEIIRSDE